MAELKIVRILVSVNAAEPEAGSGAAGGAKKSWQVTFTAPDHRPSWSRPRRMLGVAIGTHCFPRPHPEEPDLPGEGEPHHNLCLGEDLEPLRGTYERIVRRAIVDQDVSTFGKYLFDTLIGAEIWQAIIELAQEEEADLLELALAWQSGELDLHRLNWELMHDSEGFLAALRAEPPRAVTITRVVLDANHKSRHMEPILKCLFLIGTDLTDKRIRPGAEYLGLLRQIDRSGRAIHSRVVRTARLKLGDPERTVRSFNPDLVYLIAHGQFDGRGGAELELRLDARDEDYQRLRNPEGVFNLLAEGERLPAMAVLSACNTGQSSGRVEIKGAHETAPMAAYLVARGIPVVIGMAGEVADGACRHFTRRFGEAIVRGESLVAATAEGRRAAFAHDPTGEKSADWAFPAVFMSAAVELGWVPSPKDSGSAPPIERWVDCYHKHRRAEPVFCGRHEFFDAYYDLFDRNRPSTLGAYVVPRSRLDRESLPGGEDEQGSRGYGKTRLLKELAVQAIHDGHIPIVVTSDGEDWAPPNTVPALVNELYKALNRATDAYGVEVAAGQVEALKDQLHGMAAQLNAQVTRVFKEENYSVTARVISAALTTDMTQLIEKAHAKPEHEFLRKMGGSAILFLDEVESYEEEFVSKLFGGALLGAGGLRPESALPASDSEPWAAAKTILPVVMTLTTEGAPNTILKAIRERGKSLAWLRLEQLTRFDFPAQPDEKRQQLPAALLAYEHVLLNPFDKNAQLRRDVSNKPYALDHKVDDEKWEFWYTMLRDEYGGLPIYFTSKGCFRTVQIISRPNEFLIEANDEELLRRHEQGPEPGGEPSGGGTT